MYNISIKCEESGERKLERLKRVLRLIFRNLYYYRVDYIRTFFILRFVQFGVILPGITLLIHVMMEAAGVVLITGENLMSLLEIPLVILILIIIILIVLIFIYYEMGFLILLAYHQQRSIPYSWKSLWKRLNQKVVYFISVQTLLIVFYFLLVIPFISSVLPIALFQNLYIPNFIVDELLASTKGIVLYVGLLIGLLLIGLRFIFTLPYFTVYQSATLWEAVKMSWKFSRRKLLEMLGMLGVVIIIHASILAAVLTMTFIPLFGIERLIPSWGLVVAAFTLTFAEGALLVFFMFLQSFFTQILVLVAFNLTRTKALISQNQSFRKTIRNWTITVSIFAFFIMSGVNYFNLKETIYEPDSLVIAHRGFMERGVENTISSIEASAEAGAEMVEIDIQQTKDGQFVVFHDRTLSRLAGKGDSVYDLTLDELTTITVRAGGLSDTIPSLQQVITRSKELDIQLLIELKLHGYETDDFLERLIAQLDAESVLDLHYVQSLNTKLMDRLEQLEPRIHTGHVFTFVIGTIPETNVDFLAVEQFFASPFLVEQAKRVNMELFVWTVNSNRDIQRFYELGVDGIITNHPDSAVQIRHAFDEGKFFVRRLINKLNINF